MREAKEPNFCNGIWNEVEREEVIELTKWK